MLFSHHVRHCALTSFTLDVAGAQRACDPAHVPPGASRALLHHVSAHLALRFACAAEERAAQEREAGNAAYKAGDLALALQHFSSALQADPSPCVCRVVTPGSAHMRPHAAAGRAAAWSNRALMHLKLAEAAAGTEAEVGIVRGGRRRQRIAQHAHAAARSNTCVHVWRTVRQHCSAIQPLPRCAARRCWPSAAGSPLAQAQYRKACALERMGDTQRALAAAEAAAALAPDEASVLNLLARLEAALLEQQDAAAVAGGAQGGAAATGAAASAPSAPATAAAQAASASASARAARRVRTRAAQEAEVYAALLRRHGLQPPSHGDGLGASAAPEGVSSVRLSAAEEAPTALSAGAADAGGAPGGAAASGAGLDSFFPAPPARAPAAPLAPAGDSDSEGEASRSAQAAQLAWEELVAADRERVSELARRSAAASAPKRAKAKRAPGSDATARPAGGEAEARTTSAAAKDTTTIALPTASALLRQWHDVGHDGAAFYSHIAAVPTSQYKKMLKVRCRCHVAAVHRHRHRRLFLSACR